MKSILHNQPSFRKLLSIWSNPTAAGPSPDGANFIQRSFFQEDAFSLSPTFGFVIDVTNMKYLYMSKNVQAHTGYSAEEFMVKGYHFTYSLVHPEDRPELIEKVQQRQAQFLRTLPRGDYGKYRFSYTYRLKRADGVYVQMLKQSSVVQADEDGNPALLLGIGTDITHLKKDNSISLSIARLDQGCIETPGAGAGRDCVVSPRELEVLSLIVEGKSTSDIAETLKISSFTVKNHRRNMLEKTGAKNMAEVVKLAFFQGLFG